MTIFWTLISPFIQAHSPVKSELCPRFYSLGSSWFSLVWFELVNFLIEYHLDPVNLSIFILACLLDCLSRVCRHCLYHRELLLHCSDHQQDRRITMGWTTMTPTTVACSMCRDLSLDPIGSQSLSSLLDTVGFLPKFWLPLVVIVTSNQVNTLHCREVYLFRPPASLVAQPITGTYSCSSPSPLSTFSPPLS